MSDSLEQYINMGGQLPPQPSTPQGSMQQLEKNFQLDRQQYATQFQALDDRLHHLQRTCLELGMKIHASSMLCPSQLINILHYDHELIAYHTVFVDKSHRECDMSHYERDRAGVEIEMEMQREKEQDRVGRLQEEINACLQEQDRRNGKSMEQARMELKRLRQRVVGSEKYIQERIHRLEEEDKRYVEALTGALETCILNMEAQSRGVSVSSRGMSVSSRGTK